MEIEEKRHRKHWEEGPFRHIPEPHYRRRYEEYMELVQKCSGEQEHQAFRLELGCGEDGRLATLIPNYIGLSISYRELARVRRAGNDTAFFLCADAQRVPLRGMTVAMTFEHAFLEHVPRPEEVLSEIIRIMRPGGVIIHDTAWNVRSWASNPATYKSYSECNIREKLFKISIPIANSLIFRFACTFPFRLRQEFRQCFKNDFALNYKKLTPNYELKIGSDVDACSSIDPHALIMFYKSRGFETLRFCKRLFFRTGPVVIRASG